MTWESFPRAAPSTWADTARLVRRTGFGATGRAIDTAVVRGADRYLAALLAADPNTDPGALRTPPPTFEPIPPVAKGADKTARKAHNQALQAQLQQLTTWWLRRMVAVEQPFGEKLTFLWHNHFATAATKVRRAGLMLAQNEKQRRLGRGPFRDLAWAMLTDAATLYWLDGQRNVKGAPNENLAREFMELFALGHGDGYTETDVREGARALTGWKIGLDGSTAVRPKLHDDGIKRLLGVTGPLDAAGYCDAVLGRPAGTAYVLTRTWGQLASGHPPTAATLAALTSAYGQDRRLGSMLSALLSAPEFTAARGTSVITPVEWLVGAVRALRVPMVDDAAAKKLLPVLRGLGQVPFYPPSVGGWPPGTAFLSTSAADLRMKTAATLVRSADLDPVSSVSPTSRVDAVAHLLGVPGWTDRTAAALKDSAADPRTLVTVALNAPEYLAQ